ncbi:MAG TPA: ATP-binding protein [Nitrospiria bacterium]|jgi:signal transduction histidine kinase|nr:ATP-binding protein [Nitrospiria bacterium]
MMLLILLTTTGLLFVLNYQMEKQVLTDQIRQRALLMGKTLQLNLSRLLLRTDHQVLANLSEDDRQQIRDFIQHFSDEEARFDIFSVNEGINDLYFMDDQNKVVIDNPAQREGRTLPPDEQIGPETMAYLKKNKIDTRIQNRGDHTYMFMTFPVFQKNRLLGLGRIEMSMDSAVAQLDRIKLWGLFTTAGLFMIALLFASYFAKSVTRPIGELVRAAVRIGQGDFDQRLDESRRDEIGVLMATFNRMTEGIVKLEETQKRVEKLEIASQLAARVAHEIKNPLNSIGLIIDHMRDRFAPASQPEREKFLDLSSNIQREVDRLNKIVEGFLRSAKPISLSRQPTDLNGLIDETLASIIPEADQQKVTIHRHYQGNLPRLSVDYHQLRQALLNLLINALQAMPTGGELSLTTSALNHGTEAVAVSIADTGCGIPPENLPRLFGTYFTTKERGFGLGLSIVERIVQEHGGRIKVESRVGRGSVFTLLFPIQGETNHA